MFRSRGRGGHGGDPRDATDAAVVGVGATAGALASCIRGVRSDCEVCAGAQVGVSGSCEC